MGIIYIQVNMKKILFTFLILAFCAGLQGQKITALTEATVIDGTSLFMVRAGATGDVIKRITVANVFKDLTLTGTIVLPGTTSIGDVSATEIGYVNGVSSAIQTQFTGKINVSDTAAMLDPYLTSVGAENLSDLTPMLVDTIPLVTFGLGSGQTGDTAVFVNGALGGSFYNEGSDTLVITQLMGVLVAGVGTETVSVQISWSDTLKAIVPVNLNAAALAITSHTVGTSDVSFPNPKIPPNKHVWCAISGVSLANKPTFLSVTLSGYKIPKY